MNQTLTRILSAIHAMPDRPHHSEPGYEHWLAEQVFIRATEAATEEIELLRVDAARYRFLRESKNAYPLFFIAQRDCNNIVVQFTGELADTNIDEIMEKTQALMQRK